MTTKTLTGKYLAGYSLSSNYSTLVLTASAYVAGKGVRASSPATIRNRGTIKAGPGVRKHAPGFTGIELSAGGSVANFGEISGGKGNARTRVGGDGGDGVGLASGAVTNRGTIFGGAADGTADPGGTGGMGVAIVNGGNLVNSGAIGGGGGGSGGFYRGGQPGGLGGTGVTLSGGVVTNTKGGAIEGGAGGPGGFGQHSGYSYDGSGGGGGDGVQDKAAVSLTNAGLIRGGAGGGGVGGGAGGAGVLAAGGAVENSGSIAGGAGAQTSGNGGTGLYLSSVASFINSGHVGGGDGGNATPSNDFVGYQGGDGGTGVILKAGGSLANLAGDVSGGAGGAGGAGYDNENGGLGGDGGSGVYLEAAGSLANTGGTITGGAGGSGGVGDTYDGAGGAGGTGVILVAGGLVINTGTIEGGMGGPGGGESTPPGAYGNGIKLTTGGTVVNGGSEAAAALIEGATGVLAGASGAATVVNYGTIQSGAGPAVQFWNASDKLIAEAGSVFLGAVSGAGGMLELAGGTGAITGVGTGGTASGGVSLGFDGFGFYQMDAGGVWTVTGTTSLTVSQRLVDFATLIFDGSVTNAGTIRVGATGDLVVASALDNPGAVIANGTLTVEGAVSGAGVAEINGGTLNFLGAFDQAVTFLGAGTLELSDSQAYSGQISGFPSTGGGELDLDDIGFVYAGEATFSGTATGGTLTVTDGTHTARITLDGDYLDNNFVASSDGHGGVYVTDATAQRPPSDTAFVSAMASLGASPAHLAHTGEARPAAEPLLTGPRVALA